MMDKLIVAFLFVAFVFVALWPMPVWDKVLFLVLVCAVGEIAFQPKF